MATAEWAVEDGKSSGWRARRDQAERAVSAIGYGFDLKRHGSPGRFKSRGGTLIDLDCSKTSWLLVGDGLQEPGWEQSC